MFKYQHIGEFGRNCLEVCPGKILYQKKEARFGFTLLTFLLNFAIQLSSDTLEIMVRKPFWNTLNFGNRNALSRTKSESLDAVVISSRFDPAQKETTAPRQLKLSKSSHVLLAEAVRVLKTGGMLFIYGLPHDLPHWGCQLAQFCDLGVKMEFKYWIALDIDNRKHSRFLSSSHMGLLMFAKVSHERKNRTPISLNTKTVKIPHRLCPACKQNVKDWGGKKHLMNPLGATPSDVWRDLPKTKIKSNKAPAFVLDRIFALVAQKGSKHAHIVQRDAPFERNKNTNLKTVFPTRKNGDPPDVLEFNKVYLSECCGFLDQVHEMYPAGIFDMVFADPPYNLSKGYSNYDDSLGDSNYIDWCNNWLAGMAKTLKPGGSLFVLNLPKWALHHAAFLSEVLQFRHWIVWDALSDPRGKLMPAHYALLYYTKPGGKPTFKYNPATSTPKAGVINPPVSPKYCLRASCIKKRNQITADERVELSDIWSDIHRIKHKRDRDAHPCQLPEKLMERLIRLTTKEGDVVFDPFCGAGTTAIAAHKLKRRFVTTDLDEKYVRITNEKLSHMKEAESQFGIRFVPRHSVKVTKHEVSKKGIETFLQTLARKLRREPSEQDIQAARPELLATIDRIYPSRMAAIKRSRIVLNYVTISGSDSRLNLRTTWQTSSPAC